MVSNIFNVMQMNSSGAQYNLLQDISATSVSSAGVYGLNFNLLDYNNLLLSFYYIGSRGNSNQCGLQFNNCTYSYNISAILTNSSNDLTVNTSYVTPSTDYWYISSHLYNYTGNYQMFLKSIGGNIYLAYSFLKITYNSKIYYFDVSGTMTFNSQPTTLTTYSMNNNGSNNSIASASDFKIYGAK